MDKYTCNTCKRYLPLNDKYFYKESTGKWKINCKKCCNQYGKNRLLALEEGTDAWWNHIYSKRRAKAKERNIEFNLSIEDLKHILNQDECTYCGHEFSDNDSDEGLVKTIDRVDNNIGYLLDNCVLSCKRCNSRKNSMTEEIIDERIEVKKQKINLLEHDILTLKKLKEDIHN